MIAFCGYDFCGDGNSLSPATNNIGNIVNTKISNAEFDDMLFTLDTTSAFSTDKPTEWDLNTIMWANFEGDLDAGNLEFTTSEVSSIKVKRKDSDSSTWITLYEKEINEPEDLNFVFNDFTNANDVTYTYAWVPILSGVEGNYVTKDVDSEFNGIFVADNSAIYKFYAEAQINNNQMVNKVGVIEPLGSQYPIITSNAITNYQTGSLSGMILADFLETGVLDRNSMTIEKNALLSFLTNKKVKVIKGGWNNELYLCSITGNATVNMVNYSVNIMTMTANWAEVGDATDGESLYRAGIAPAQ